MKEFFADADIGLIGLLFFFGVFVFIAVRTYWPGRKEEIEKLKNIPLED